MSDFPTQIGPNVGGIRGIKLATDGFAKVKASPFLFEILGRIVRGI